MEPGLTPRENYLLDIWKSLPIEKKKEAVALYERMTGDEPELMGLFPLLAALVPVAKKAFSIGKKVVGAIRKKSPAQAPAPAPQKQSGFQFPSGIPPALLLGGGALLLILLLRR
jgi:hypothetical protein